MHLILPSIPSLRDGMRGNEDWLDSSHTKRITQKRAEKNSAAAAPEAPWASNGCVATRERQQDYGRLSLIRPAKSTSPEMTQKCRW
ncbi:hypothetical protein AVEN_169030-1 [Araneus ventricosus]|uniref:Uncharacterized protein n=1 Tax=Araneus ventricosus TaxID=182803 RepID=A0A4Y2H045_ARAVE|nr:hypothetical protein AVEN_169030-1 [Araneus ventricosus]